MPRSRLAQRLLDKGLISEEQLTEAENQDGPLVRVLVEMGAVTEKNLYRTLAEQVGAPFFDFEETDIDPIAVSKLSPERMTEWKCMPVAYDDQGRLLVAALDPMNPTLADNLSTAIRGERIQTTVAVKSELLAAIEEQNTEDEDIDAIAAEIDVDEDEPSDLAELTAVVEDAPIVKLVDGIIDQAVRAGASDIHVEPGDKQLRVRYRIDGVLIEKMKQPKKFAPAIISRLKIMAAVDIAEKRIPQDGRISRTFNGKPIDLRFSTLPTAYGEKVVMRILDTSSVLLTLDDLGFLEHNEKMYAESYNKPYGMILVTGPTGSGKSTTLYATVNVLNQPGVNITTTEDPVEYMLDGVNQVPVRSDIGMTFAVALRSILRQDPDIVLVGEMRDQETAKMGVEAALTGHLVLSTLHTNDAPSAIVRLTEMGIEPFLVASAVDCVLAQRLARRVCSKCFAWEKVGKDVLVSAGFDEAIVEENPDVPIAQGCKVCNDTGYKGRLAVHEVMPVTEEVEKLTVAHASSEDISRLAQEQGMRTLRQDALAKALSGITTLEEVSRVVV